MHAPSNSSVPFRIHTPSSIILKCTVLQEYQISTASNTSRFAPLSNAITYQPSTTPLWTGIACSPANTFVFIYNTCSQPITVSYMVSSVRHTPWTIHPRHLEPCLTAIYHSAPAGGLSRKEGKLCCRAWGSRCDICFKRALRSISSAILVAQRCWGHRLPLFVMHLCSE